MDFDISFVWHRYSNPFPFFQTRITLNKDIDAALLQSYYLYFKYTFSFSLVHDFVLC